MNRRSFLKLVGLGAVGAAVAKQVVAEKPKSNSWAGGERYYMDEALTDDQYDAIMKKLAKQASDTMDAQIAHVFNLRY